MRRAAGDVAGLTVGAQVQKAAKTLGYEPDDWRPREFWYGRGASPSALDDLRHRFAAWSERERLQATPPDLVQRLGAMREGLAELQSRFAALEAEVARLLRI